MENVKQSPPSHSFIKTHNNSFKVPLSQTIGSELTSASPAPLQRAPQQNGRLHGALGFLWVPFMVEKLNQSRNLSHEPSYPLKSAASTFYISAETSILYISNCGWKMCEESSKRLLRKFKSRQPLWNKAHKLVTRWRL